ncbi:MAG: gephyrin-like molybdotransferase Glp [Castellaniella sp.]
MSLLDFDAAQARLAASAVRPETDETLPLEQLDGRVLAHDITARHDLPPADNSAMDGYAVRWADITSAGLTLPVQQRCFAGQTPEPLQPGQAIRLFTGSLIPDGADTVIMQEDTREDEHGVTFERPPKSAGTHIRRQGEDMHKDHVILTRGTSIGPGAIAMLAAQGFTQASVTPKVRVGILSTGDELVAPGQALPAAGIYNSNTPMLAALCRGLGAQPALLRHAPDDTGAIASALAALCAECDLVLSAGGVSVGEKDLVKPVIESMGGTLELWRVRMKPGKPVALAHLRGRPVVGLPGNPVSAFVVFTLLVSPLIRGMQGRHTVYPPVRRGVLAHSGTPGGERDDFLRVQAHQQGPGTPQLTAHPQQSSGAQASLAWAHGLARIPAGARLHAGAEVDWYAFSDWLA